MTSLQTIDITSLKAITSSPDPLYYISDQGKEGVFWLDTSGSPATNNDATVIIGNSPTYYVYRRVFSGPANVTWFGASPAVADNSTAFNNALIDCNSIFIPEGDYTILYPIVIPATLGNSFKTITGAGVGKTKIIKDGNNLPSSYIPIRVAPNRSGTVTDDLNVDACFIIDYYNDPAYPPAPANPEYANNISISSLSLSHINRGGAYAIFAPRNTHFTLSKIIATEFKTGYFTYDTWTAKFETVEFILSSSSSASNYSGFQFEDDGNGSGTGTTCTFENCLSVGYNYGFNLYGLTYSSIIDSSVDNIKGMGYKFYYCHQINLIGCGAEAIELDRHLASVLFIESSEINIQGFYNYSTTSTVTGSDIAAGIIIDSSNVNIQNCKLDNFISVPANTYNIVIQNTSYLWSSGLVIPTNGSNFISYTNGSSWIKNSITGTNLLGNAKLFPSTIPIPSIDTLFPIVSLLPSTTGLPVGTTVFNTNLTPNPKLQTWDGTNWKDLW